MDERKVQRLIYQYLQESNLSLAAMALKEELTQRGSSVSSLLQMLHLLRHFYHIHYHQQPNHLQEANDGSTGQLQMILDQFADNEARSIAAPDMVELQRRAVADRKGDGHYCRIEVGVLSVGCFLWSVLLLL